MSNIGRNSSQAAVPSSQNFKAMSRKQIIKVRENVHVAVGYALANMIMIEGIDGIVIIDTTENETSALEILQDFRKITTKPIKAIVLTHFHGDHINGTAALLDFSENSGRDIMIIAHSTLTKERNRYMVTSDCNDIGASRQFGITLKRKSILNVGSRFPRVVDPTHTFNDEMKASIAGVDFTFLHTPGETDDQISIWIPEWKVVMTADNIVKSFPNIYAIRGAPARNSESWYKSLDVIRRLKPKYMVPSHLEPVIGEKVIYNILTHYRDAIQFVHDQTVRLLNNGLNKEEIVKKVSLPSILASHPYLQELYGGVEWSVKGIISWYIGWFDRDLTNLYPIPSHVKVVRLQNLLSKNHEKSCSGVKKMLTAAEEALILVDEELKVTGKILFEEAQWSLEMSSGVMKTTSPDSHEYKLAEKASKTALKHLAAASFNQNAQRYYRTASVEVSTNFVKKLAWKKRAKKIKYWPIEYSMKRMQYSLKSEECFDDEHLTLVFNFPDVQQIHSYILRHCILEYQDTPELIARKYDVKATMNSNVWKELLVGDKSLSSVVKSGEVEIVGKEGCLERFMNLLEMCPQFTRLQKNSLL